MKIYDSIYASTLEVGDYAILGGEETYIKQIDDNDDHLVVHAYSFETGDDETYLIDPDSIIELWSYDE